MCNLINRQLLSCFFFLDGIVDIFQRIRPSFIFCDSDILDSIKDVINDIELDAKVFTVNESVDGFDSINVLMNETGNEDSFVYVINVKHQKHMLFVKIGNILFVFQLHKDKRCLLSHCVDCVLVWFDRARQIDCLVACQFPLYVH